MAPTTETSERHPWTSQRVLERLDRIDVAEAGDSELRNKVASLAMALVTEALDAPVVDERFDIDDGLIEANRQDTRTIFAVSDSSQLFFKLSAREFPAKLRSHP
jgi:hypothetical protein